MKVEQLTWDSKDGWKKISNQNLSDSATLVFAFGPAQSIKKKSTFADLKKAYPNADIVLSSSCQSVLNGIISDDKIVVSALHFEKSSIQALQVNMKDVKDSFDAGAHLSANLDKDNLKGLILLSDALPIVNGAHLLTGIHLNLAAHVPVMGGMVSECETGLRPCVGLNGTPQEGNIIGIGFSGDHLQFGYGMEDGWTPFGTERFITKSKDNEVYKLDHMTPLELYELYLNGLVDDPIEASRQFPFGIKVDNIESRKIRSAVGIDSKTGKATFSGDMPEGERVRMMKTNVSSLIDSAGEAARNSYGRFNMDQPEFSLLINCKGRLNVLKDWTQEEIDAVASNLKKNLPFIGMYSLGEFSPMEANGKSELLNQSIIITSLKES